MFGAAIFVHEFGHYWMARKRGLKVVAFAIGMGPKIFAWVKDGIEYSVRWIPAGGFVKLPQMITSEALEGGVDPAEAEPLPPVTPFSKILVAFAGPIMNIVFAFVLATIIYFVGLPIPVNPSVIGYVDPTSPEGKLGIHEGDKIVEVNSKAVSSWQEVREQTIYAQTNVIPEVIERSGVRQTYQLTAHPNDLVVKVLNLDPRDHPEIAELKPGMPAETAGLKLNDKFLSYGGVPISGQEQLVDLIHKSSGQRKEVLVDRQGKQMTLTVTPVYDSDGKQGMIGVALTDSSTMVYMIPKRGPLPWVQLRDVVVRTVKVLKALFHSKQTGVRAKDLSGPVGILSMLAAQVNTDYRLALSFLVLLNVNLAILNLLPIPVLDGGHITMSVIEKIRRRPLNMRVVEYVNTGFAVLLISFMLYVTFFDLKRFPFFKMMFKRDVQMQNEKQEPPPANSQVLPAK